jgi:hypothetical protein
MRVEALKTGHSGPALLITWTIRFLPFPSSYLPDRQLCLQVCAWLSQELRHGVLNVVGQTRLQEASWLAQSARHRSDVASANRNLLELVALAAKTGPLTKQSTATPNASFMEILQLDHRLGQSIFYTRRRRDLSIEFRISTRELLDHAMCLSLPAFNRPLAFSTDCSLKIPSTSAVSSERDQARLVELAFAEALTGIDPRPIKITHDLCCRGDIARVDLAPVLERKTRPGAPAPSGSLTQDSFHAKNRRRIRRAAHSDVRGLAGWGHVPSSLREMDYKKIQVAPAISSSIDTICPTWLFCGSDCRRRPGRGDRHG